MIMQLEETLVKEEASHAVFYGELTTRMSITEGKLYKVHKSADSFKWAEKEHYIIDDEGRTNFTAMIVPQRKLYK